MSEENKTQEEAQPITQEIVEVEWEEVKELLSVRAALTQTEDHLARLLLNVEKQKAQLLNRIDHLERGMYQLGSELKTAKGISEELTYELKLPANEGEKGYFLRKE